MKWWIHISSVVTYLRENSFLLHWNSCKQRSKSLTRCCFWSTVRKCSIHFIHSFLIDIQFMQNGEYTAFWYLLWHYVGGPLSRRSLCMFWRETKQRPENRDLPETGSRQGNASRRVGRRNPEKAVGDGRRWGAVGSRHRTAEETSRHETESSGSEGRPVKMSQHSSWFVEISLEIHASVSLQGMQCHNLTFLHMS